MAVGTIDERLNSSKPLWPRLNPRSNPHEQPKNITSIRSSAAEYLTFVAASGQGGVEAVYADDDVWLSQKMMGDLYGVNVRTVSEHLKNIFFDNELEQESVIRNFRITAADGKNYNTQRPARF